MANGLLPLVLQLLILASFTGSAAAADSETCTGAGCNEVDGDDAALLHTRVHRQQPVPPGILASPAAPDVKEMIAQAAPLLEKEQASAKADGTDLAAQAQGEVDQSSSETEGGPSLKSSHQKKSVAGKSVYIIMIDRFNRGMGGYQPGNKTACPPDSNNWCNGTLSGIQDQLQYIKGMDFDCIWITPPVKNYDGFDGQSGWGYGGYWAEDYYDVDPHFSDTPDVQYSGQQNLKDLVDAAHAIDMCVILDIVVNHCRPLHSTTDLCKVNPFNKEEYYHTLNKGELTWDEYTYKTTGWPAPRQGMGPGASCHKTYNTSQPESCKEATEGAEYFDCYDWTNGGNYCNNYDPSNGPYNASTYLGDKAAGPPELKYCGPGNFDCPGYNVEANLEGWFYDLADLNQSVPFVRDGLLDWAESMVTNYSVDGMRLDTAAFVTHDFLHLLQERVGKLGMEIFGEVTTTNVSFHASFTKQDDKDILAGLENFPLEYMATAGYCGFYGEPSAVVAKYNLTKLAETTKEQSESGLYSNVDLLMNFMDNQDDQLITTQGDTAPTGGPFGGGAPTGGCVGDNSRQMNGLVWAMFARGTPAITWGTEQGNNIYRNSLWQFGWKTDTWQYKFIKTMNNLRHDYDISLKDAVIKQSDEDKFVWQRKSKRWSYFGTWIYTNNHANNAQPVVYTAVPPVPIPGYWWFDGLTGGPANIDYKSKQKTVKAPSTAPMVLVLKPILR